MKLVRYGAAGSEKPGLIDKAGKLRDLSAHVKDFSGDALSPASLAKLAALDPASLPAVDGSPRMGSPIGGLPKFIAIGLNYVDHAKEAGMAIPSEPIVFMKALNSLCGPNDDVLVMKPRGLNHGFIVGVIPPYAADGSVLCPDWIVQGGGTGLRRERGHAYPIKSLYKSGGVVDWSGRTLCWSTMNTPSMTSTPAQNF